MTANADLAHAGALAGYRRHWPLLLGGAFLVVYAAVGWAFLQRGLFSCQNLLFDADVVRVTDDMTRWSAKHWRSSVHPIFPLMLLPLGAPAAHVMPAELVALALVVVAGASTVTLAGATLRTLVPELEAALLTVLYASSASSLFMFSIIDSFAFSALGIAATLYAIRTRSSAARALPCAILSFGAVITNLVHVLLAPLLASRGGLRERARESVLLGCWTVGVTAVLAAVQWMIVPNTPHFMLPTWLTTERRYAPNVSTAGSMLSRLDEVLVGFFGHAFAAPEPAFVRRAGFGLDWVSFADRQGPSGYTQASGLLALLIAGLLAWASYVNLSRGASRTETLAVGGAIGFHLTLMLAYGSEPMLYSPLWMLSLVLWVGLALARVSEAGRRSPPRWLLGVVALWLLSSNATVVARIAHHYDAATSCAWHDRACILAVFRPTDSDDSP